jgi:hypothetical protein
VLGDPIAASACYRSKYIGTSERHRPQRVFRGVAEVIGRDHRVPRTALEHQINGTTAFEILRALSDFVRVAR